MDFKNILKLSKWKEYTKQSFFTSRKKYGLDVIDDQIEAYHLIPHENLTQRCSSLEDLIVMCKNWRHKHMYRKHSSASSDEVDEHAESLITAAENKYHYLQAVIRLYSIPEGEAHADLLFFQKLTAKTEQKPVKRLVRSKSFSAKSSTKPVLQLRRRNSVVNLRVDPFSTPVSLKGNYNVEAIDPLHRALHNSKDNHGMGQYIHEWLEAKKIKKATLPFFKWLEVRLPEGYEAKSVKYHTTVKGRAPYLLSFVNGLIWQYGSDNAFSTAGMNPGDPTGMYDWCIFVLSPQGALFAGGYDIGEFHHSSFLGGGDVLCAGQLRIESGKLLGISPKSGHYKPSGIELCNCLRFFQKNGVSIDQCTVMFPDFHASEPYQNAFLFTAQDFLHSNGTINPKSVKRKPTSVLDPSSPIQMKQCKDNMLLMINLKVQQKQLTLDNIKLLKLKNFATAYECEKLAIEGIVPEF